MLMENFIHMQYVNLAILFVCLGYNEISEFNKHKLNIIYCTLTSIHFICHSMKLNCSFFSVLFRFTLNKMCFSTTWIHFNKTNDTEDCAILISLSLACVLFIYIIFAQDFLVLNYGLIR